MTLLSSFPVYAIPVIAKFSNTFKNASIPTIPKSVLHPLNLNYTLTSDRVSSSPLLAYSCLTPFIKSINLKDDSNPPFAPTSPKGPKNEDVSNASDKENHYPGKSGKFIFHQKSEYFKSGALISTQMIFKSQTPDSFVTKISVESYSDTIIYLSVEFQKNSTQVIEFLTKNHISNNQSPSTTCTVTDLEKQKNLLKILNENNEFPKNEYDSFITLIEKIQKTESTAREARYTSGYGKNTWYWDNVDRDGCFPGNNDY